jgi:hypothetical protein
MESNSLKHAYKEWFATATPEQIAFVDSVFKLCEDNYSNGGDVVVECMTPGEIIAQFKSLDEVRTFCGLKLEQELNAREGADSDPVLERHRRFVQYWPE